MSERPEHARLHTRATVLLVLAVVVYLGALFVAAVRMTGEVEASAVPESAERVVEVTNELYDRPLYLVFGVGLPLVLAVASLLLFIVAHRRMLAADPDCS